MSLFGFECKMVVGESLVKIYRFVGFYGDEERGIIILVIVIYSGLIFTVFGI